MTYHSPFHVCVSNTSPKNFEKICLVFFEAPTETSTCRSKTANCEKMYDYDIASRFLWGEIAKIEVEEDFESIPHKAFFFVSERNPGMEGDRIKLDCREEKKKMRTEHTKEKVRFPSREWFEEARNTCLESGVKIVGQESLRFCNMEYDMSRNQGVQEIRTEK